MRSHRKMVRQCGSSIEAGAKRSWGESSAKARHAYIHINFRQNDSPRAWHYIRHLRCSPDKINMIPKNSNILIPKNSNIRVNERALLRDTGTSGERCFPTCSKIKQTKKNAFCSSYHISTSPRMAFSITKYNAHTHRNIDTTARCTLRVRVRAVNTPKSPHTSHSTNLSMGLPKVAATYMYTRLSLLVLCSHFERAATLDNNDVNTSGRTSFNTTSV